MTRRLLMSSLILFSLPSACDGDDENVIPTPSSFALCDVRDVTCAKHVTQIIAYFVGYNLPEQLRVVTTPESETEDDDLFEFSWWLATQQDWPLLKNEDIDFDAEDRTLAQGPMPEPLGRVLYQPKKQQLHFLFPEEAPSLKQDPQQKRRYLCGFIRGVLDFLRSIHDPQNPIGGVGTKKFSLHEALRVALAHDLLLTMEASAEAGTAKILSVDAVEKQLNAIAAKLPTLTETPGRVPQGDLIREAALRKILQLRKEAGDWSGVIPEVYSPEPKCINQLFTDPPHPCYSVVPDPSYESKNQGDLLVGFYHFTLPELIVTFALELEQPPSRKQLESVDYHLGAYWLGIEQPSIVRQDLFLCHDESSARTFFDLLNKLLTTQLSTSVEKSGTRFFQRDVMSGALKQVKEKVLLVQGVYQSELTPFIEQIEKLTLQKGAY